jgi:hypothetical protein
MLRDALYEAGDNPIQGSLLPKDNRPTIQVAASTMSAAETRRETRRRLGRLWLISSAAMVIATIVDSLHYAMPYQAILGITLLFKFPRFDAIAFVGVAAAGAARQIHTSAHPRRESARTLGIAE